MNQMEWPTAEIREVGDEIKFKNLVLGVAPVLFLILAAVLLIPGCTSTSPTNAPEKQPGCGNQAPSGECSSAKPYYCDNGTLLYEPAECGCADGLRVYNGTCIKLIACPDGTLTPDCSSTKPYLCQNGVLVENASVCGCPNGTIPDNDTCMDIYMTDPSVREFPYTLYGQTYNLTTTLYGGLNLYLSTQNGYEYEYNSNNIPSQQEIESSVSEAVIDQPDQVRLINNLVASIENASANKQDQARIAISLVQTIPYDWTEYYQAVDSNFSSNEKYPYQVLYSDAGICEDKSELLALLLEKLGFGVALLEFSAQDHEAVGISCPLQYSIVNSGYCFIETTSPNIITYSTGTYIGNVTLGLPSSIIPISDGLSFNASQEYADAQEYGELEALSNPLNQSDYAEWVLLVNKYGLVIGNTNASITGSNASCPIGSTYCNDLCWPGCSDGASSECNSQGLVCCPAGSTYCNGECGQCGEYQVGSCTAQGWQCEYNPDNCPPGMHSCNGDCWDGCSRGSWRCTSQGGVCYV
jgi:hypothetical protein